MGSPTPIALQLGAPFVLALAFGRSYDAAAPVLRIMGPTVGLTYVSTVCAIALIQRGRAWTMATVSLVGMVATVAFNAVLIPWGVRVLGPAGGAQGAAWADLASELVVAVVLGALCRECWRDARLVRTIAALASGVTATAVVAAFLPGSGLPGSLIAGAVFGALVLVVGGVDRDDVMFCRHVLDRRAPRAALASELS